MVGKGIRDGQITFLENYILMTSQAICAEECLTSGLMGCTLQAQEVVMMTSQ